MDFRSLITLVEMSEADARQVFFTNGVDPHLSPDALKTAYRKLMMAHHPDRGGDLETAKSITSAYDTLKSLQRPFRSDDGHTPSAAEPEAQPQGAGFSMDHPKFSHIDYVKWYFEQLTAGQPSQAWSVMNFDGHFFRNSFTIRGNADLFPKMAEVMIQWDRHYDCAAVMVGTRAMLERGTIAVINVFHEEVKPMVTLEFDSFNLNPANDQQFCRKLPKILAAIHSGEFVSQHMLD